MPQSPLHSSPLKDGRQILSEKSANACLSPARSPAKQTHLTSPSPKKLLPSPSFIAQKRSINQVDAEDVGSHLFAQEQRVEAPPAHHEAPIRSTSIADLDSRPESTSTSASDAMNLDVSKQTNQQIQQQSLHTTSPAQNATKPTPKEPEPAPATSQTVPSDPQTRKLFIQEKAILLRNRLQNAMRHVRDPQFDRRVSELEEHSRKYPRLSGSASGSVSGTQLQHLEQKYGTDEAEEEAEAENEPTLSTPRAPEQTQSREEQREIIRIPDDEEGETTPTQDNAIQRTDVNVDNRLAASPTQMILSSPTYNSAAQTGRFDDDRPCARETTVATSPSSSLRGEGRGDGDAVDGLLKLMRTSTGTTTSATTGMEGGMVAAEERV
ncbi:hypothetical protein BDW62DRAFT_181045 [Aspergillus aurantiobrunneus]